MTADDLGPLTWRKSRHSSVEECVEVAGLPAHVAMRDSKDPHGPALVVSRAAFRRFVSGLG
ncbi:DUF397 domain-containing protein [Saccharopolyspora gloriosae]|nr:DUF397 domain-containing protein [Saccharopolyspora gloriosae]